ncbi:leucine aminopeptidase 1 [Prunus yedoensis var. nudiflora]|uniref:Leucine aminopeptidase 1 n=1 Tax=Prunus yedoensis var. nudiflora TaxID=2094558 RepID=A0A314XWI8_PRUYE|nr:leucine aminopeptidase 1 [Prunus yedoensis var. nudiflora]
MVAYVVSLASTLIAVTSPSYSSSLLTKLRSSPSLRLSFAVTPLCSRRGKLMAHTLARATLGLTFPSGLDAPKISFAAKDIDITEWKGDLLAVGVTEKDLAKDENSKFQNSILKNLDSRLGGLLAEASSEEDFTGKSGQSTVVRLPGLGSKRIGLFGLGQSASSTAAFRGLGEAAATAAKATQASDLAIVLASSEELSAKSNTASAIASGTLLGIYEDSRYKSESKKSALKSVDILGLGTGPEVEKKLKYAEDVTSGIIFGKELVNSPANPQQILHIIHLIYKPLGGPAKVKLGLVGKGLTFDSGGYNIKTGPGCSIELMKFDMGGSAAVLGAAKAIGQIKPPGVEVHFIVAACENMISGTGMRPGDIVTASNGKTIEVNNTDAEGRLTLADALVYACNQGVEKIVDLATLTGACVIALGPSIAGVFTPSDDLAKEVFAASELSGEKFWRLPLEESYWESMKSGIADMVNTGGRPGGSITAALFLKQFVDEKVEWMHIDMAGPVWSDKKPTATGFGVSTLVEWVLKNSA